MSKKSSMSSINITLNRGGGGDITEIFSNFTVALKTADGGNNAIFKWF
jgi:hypothetical protein